MTEGSLFWEMTMRFHILALAAFLSAGTSAFAQAPNLKGTVNEFTPDQRARAEAAITKAGYHPTVLQFAQDGNLFFTATRNGQTYDATVTRDGKVYFSNGLAEGSAPPS